MEQRYGLDLTRGKGGHWTDEHLDILDESLGRLPREHVGHVQGIEIGGTENWGSFLHDQLWLSGHPDALGDSTRHPGTTSVLAEHDDPVKQLEMTIAHEVGHGVHEHYAETVQRILDQAGWTEDPENPAFIPEVPDEGNDTWVYGRTNPDDYFAEMYTKAVNVPETLYDDLVAEPQLMAELLADDPTLGAQYAEAAARKRAQWDIMRGEIFGVNDIVVDDKVCDLEGMVAWRDEEHMDQTVRRFRAQADRVMTPEQLEMLFERTLIAEGAY